MTTNGINMEDRDRAVVVGNSVVYNIPAPASYASGNQSYQVADIVGGIIVHDGTSGSTATLPTAAALAAAIPDCRVGSSISCLIINGANASGTITLAAGTGGSFDANQGGGSRVIQFGTSKYVTFRFSNTTPGSQAYSVYS
jgi:hypothetical protein